MDNDDSDGDVYCFSTLRFSRGTDLYNTLNMRKYTILCDMKYSIYISYTPHTSKLPSLWKGGYYTYG